MTGVAVGALRVALLAFVAVLAALAIRTAVALEMLTHGLLLARAGAGFRRLNASIAAVKFGRQRRDRDLLARGPLDVAQLPRSSGLQNAMAMPSAPARGVRPMRWTYAPARRQVELTTG
jgi:hypothetical protein